MGAVAEAAPTKPAPGAVDASSAALATSAGSTLQDDFAAAAAEFKVPESVLLAVSYQETQWESHQGQPSTTGNYNVMGLTQVAESTAAPLTVAQVAAEEDEAGDGSKPRTPSAALMALVNDRSASKSPALHTLDTAAGLIHQPATALRGDSRQSIRGGAALLASYQSKLKHPLSGDPADWFGAVAAYSQASDQKAATGFADQVFLTIHSGASRTTADNQTVALAASPAVTVPAAATGTQQTSGLGLRAAAVGASATAATECPTTVTCTFVPADANNYYAGNRPTDGNGITTIVLHTTEGPTTAGAIAELQASGNSTHYIVDANGTVTQMVSLEDAAIHAANKSINLHSVGIENVGFAGGGSAAGNTAGTWIAQPQYLTDAALVSYVAAKYNIPLDRDHILGHDDAAYALNSTVGSQHWDPGAYFDWSYFLSLLGAPPAGSGTLVKGGTVTIAPAYSSTGAPALTGCDTSGGGGSDACPAHAANFVYLYKGASTGSGLINDSLLTATGMASGTTEIADVSDKAVYGQSFVVADISGDWTAVWYGGQKAWFYNPNGSNTVANTHPGQLIVQPSGSASVPVYGRYYPEASDYTGAVAYLADPTKCPNQVVAPLSYTIPVGQAYVAEAAVSGDYYADTDTSSATCPAPAANTEIISQTKYYPIRYNHRIAYVKASDVQVVTAAAPPKGTFVPSGPTRALDTRTTIGGAQAPVVAGKPRVLQIAGADGIPSTGVTAVVMNVTAVRPTSASFVTVYPDGVAQPATSNLNLTAGAVMPNLAVVPVVDGKVDFAVNAGSVDLVADITGYYSTTATNGSTFSSAGPVRAMDTRDGTGVPKARVAAGGTVKLKVAGANGLPSTGVTAVVMNVTAVGPSTTGVVTVYPDGITRPTASNLNFAAGQTIPNLVIVPVGANGVVDFYNYAGTVDLVADITGYFTQGSGASYVTAGPKRVMDTRDGTGVPKARVAAGGTVKLTVAGVNGLPSTGVTAVVMNVTAVGPSTAGVVTVYPDGITRPTASNLNFVAGQTIPNLVVVPVRNGVVDFYNYAGTVDLVADITGYFTS